MGGWPLVYKTFSSDVAVLSDGKRLDDVVLGASLVYWLYLTSVRRFLVYAKLRMVSATHTT